jgi:hypothetical protein
MNSDFEPAKVIRGAAAVAQMLDQIGLPGANDKTVAQILVENEMELRHLVSFALTEIAKTVR